MTPEQAAKLLETIERGRFGPSIGAHFIVAGIALIFGAVGAYLGTRATNIATKHDVEQLTRLAETVRREIADSSWQSQRLWEEKKAIYVNVARLLDDANMILIPCDMNARRVPMDMDGVMPTAIASALQEHMKVTRELSSTIAMSGIFLSPEAQKAVESFRNSVRMPLVDEKTGATIVDTLGAKNMGEFCRGMRERAMKSRDLVVAAAREDLAAGLGISDSTDRPATP